MINYTPPLSLKNTNTNTEKNSSARDTKEWKQKSSHKAKKNQTHTTSRPTHRDRKYQQKCKPREEEKNK